MEKVSRLPLSRRALVLVGLLIAGPTSFAGERKYLPRVGPTPIHFLIPVEAPVPVTLPPLDMGESKEDEEKKKAEDADDGSEKSQSKPELRTRKTAISSRPTTATPGPGVGAGNLIEGPQPDGVGGPGGGDDISRLLPDGFDVRLDDKGPLRRDLSVFLNYFTGSKPNPPGGGSKPAQRPADQEVRPIRPK